MAVHLFCDIGAILQTGGRPFALDCERPRWAAVGGCVMVRERRRRVRKWVCWGVGIDMRWNECVWDEYVWNEGVFGV